MNAVWCKNHNSRKQSPLSSPNIFTADNNSEKDVIIAVNSSKVVEKNTAKHRNPYKNSPLSYKKFLSIQFFEETL